jgi:hypothetical protein
MPHVSHPRVRKMKILSSLAATAAALTALAAPASAQAACPVLPTVKAFQAFGDSADYSLAPNGGLESGAAGWVLSSASVVTGNETFKVRATGDTRSLQIAPGGKAVTGAFCVGAEHPTFRFFARQPGGASNPDLKVYIRYITEDGETKDQQVDTLAGADFDSWEPSRAIELFEKLGFSDPTATTTARLVFEAENETGSPWRVDDVFVDPFRH